MHYGFQHFSSFRLYRIYMYVSMNGAQVSICIASIEFLVSAWTAPIRSRIISTAEHGREMRDKGVDLTSAIERCRSDTTDDRPDVDAIIIVYYNAKLTVNQNLQTTK